MQDIYTILNTLHIPYTRFDHAPVFTVAEGEALIKSLPGAPSKNLFLRDKTGTKHYLVVMHALKRADLKKLAALLGEQKLSFASPERLMKYLGVTPGSVTPLALMNDTQKAVQLIIDTELWGHDSLQFHPLINTATLVIARADMEKFFAWSGHVPRFLTV